MLRCALINLLTPLPPVRYRVLGQDAGGVGGAGQAQLADGKRAGADPTERLSTREGHYYCCFSCHVQTAALISANCVATERMIVKFNVSLSVVFFCCRCLLW